MSRPRLILNLTTILVAASAIVGARAPRPPDPEPRVAARRITLTSPDGTRWKLIVEATDTGLVTTQFPPERPAPRR